ncbi:MAG: hypothetical protein QF391_07110 [Myxococcota bacterium]|nr:hypothetical protein [Myxococcota bacterium]
MAGDSGGDGVQEGLPGESVRGQASQLAVQASRLRQAEALGRYAKTDVIDADTLSLMAELATMDDPLWTEPTPEFERLRGLVRRRHQLVQHSAAERVRSRQASTPEEHDSIEIMRRHLAEEQKRIERLIAVPGGRLPRARALR